MGNIGTPYIYGSMSINPCFSISEGYVYDVVRNKKFVSANNDVKEFDICSNFNIFAVSVMRRLELYTLLGPSYESLRWMEELLSNDVQSLTSKKISSKKHFSYSVGTKIVLLQFATTLLGINIQYFSFPCIHYINDIIDNLHISFLDDMRFDHNDDCVRYSAWDVSLGITCMISHFLPYVAIKYATAHLELMNDHNVINAYNNIDNWGLVSGCSFNAGMFHFNVEVRRYSETSMGVQVSSSF